MLKTNCAYADADCTTRMRRRAGREIALRRMAEDIGKRKRSESGPRRRRKEGDLRSTRAHRRANRRRITDFDIVNGLLISDSDSRAGIILCIQRALGIFTREGRSLLVSISARLLRLLVLKKSGMETKACVSAIYAARSNGVIAIFYHSSASALLQPEISLVDGESSFSIKAVLIGAGDVCIDGSV